MNATFPRQFQPPFLIIETGQPVASMRRHGRFPHWIRVAAGLPAEAAVVVNVEAHEPLPAYAGFAGALITGSGAMVTERRDWSERTAQWLREAAHAADDPLFAGLPGQFAAQATHLQSVLRPPDGAVVLAHSAQDACHAFRWGSATWGVQFHPEFGTTHMRGYVQAKREALSREGRCSRQLSRTIASTPHARRVLRRFVRHARSLRAATGPWQEEQA